MEYNQENNDLKVGELIAKEIQGTLSDQEAETLREWKGQSLENQEAYDSLYQQKERLLVEINEFDAPKALERVLRKHQASTQKGRVKTYWYAAAALLFFFSIGISTYVVIHKKKETQTLTSKYGDDVLPGKNKAFITLSNGSEYELKEDKEGLTIKNGSIEYADGSPIVSYTNVLSATINTPNGGQYRLILADGTKVILNSASSFTYPTHFNSDKREVTLDGEAYFEVAKNLKQPFIVNGPQQRIEVLGTKFNASFYKGEQTATTLVEGKVRIDAENGQQAVLNPGDHAVYINNKIILEQVSAQDYISWINNQFVFNNSSLEDVFAQLERWYDIQFDFPKELSQKRIYAEISRDTKLSEVLVTLEEIVKLKFTISGRRVFVRN